ncbi:MAG: hypothetical protein E7258_10020 [Lachnospiraceae bacterium]|nr:hypothetical protein [Lachnospiraceae bacterium]
MNKKLKKFLHTFFKIMIILLIATAAINIIIFGAIYFNHTSKLKKESGYLVAPGQMVEVNDHQMHVYITGNLESDTTLVFLHTSKVVDDSIALQPLFDELSDYKLVLVERSGVGFSENSGASRDIDTIMEETRLALSLSGVDGPYTLIPTGTAGIEAIHWANTYKDEVERIIGINMYYPEQFADTTTEEYCGFFDYIMVPFYKIGGQRLVAELYPDNAYGLYSDTQMKIRNALVSKNGYTKDMYMEDLATVDNAAKVAKEGIPTDVEINLIYANPLLEPYVNVDETVKNTYNEQMAANPDIDYISEYNKDSREYFAQYDNVTFEELSGPGRIYIYAPVELGKLITKYLD